MMKRKTQTLKVLSVLACLLFLSSIFFPFMSAEHSDAFLVTLHQSHFWSFRSFTEHSLSNVILGTEDYWFYDYWFKEHADGLELLFMFVAQILTLFTSLASLLIKKRNLPLAPVVLCLMVIASMVYVGEINPIQGNMSPYSYQLGYWLTFPSFSVFLTVFILNHSLERNATVANYTPTRT